MATGSDGGDKGKDARRVSELIKDMRIGMLTTRAPDGKMRSRPMAVSDTRAENTLFFLTRDTSGKIHDLEADGEVVVSFADPSKSEYVALRGSAAISREAAAVKEHWSETARPWFPDGPEDEHLAVITVTIDEAEYWDPTSSTMMLAYGYVRAMLTGKPLKDDEAHGKVTM